MKEKIITTLRNVKTEVQTIDDAKDQLLLLFNEASQSHNKYNG